MRGLRGILVSWLLLGLLLQGFDPPRQTIDTAAYPDWVLASLCHSGATDRDGGLAHEGDDHCLLCKAPLGTVSVLRAPGGLVIAAAHGEIADTPAPRAFTSPSGLPRGPPASA